MKRTHFIPVSTSSAREPLVLQVQPARAESARDFVGLETAMQGLALNARTTLALEIAATTEPTEERTFLLRAESREALLHLAAQIQARYPQARISAVRADPLQVSACEECSAVELLPGAAAYLPLRAFSPQDLLREGVDPLLGILAACNQLPPHARIVAQLALTPATPAWSAVHQRFAVEHPLAQERQQMRGGSTTPAPGVGKILALLVVVILLVLEARWHAVLFPTWLTQAGARFLQGKSPALSAGQILVLIVSGAVFLALVFGSTRLFSRLAAHFTRPTLYDQRLVAEKTTRPAYRARVRLFVVTPGEAWPLCPTLVGRGRTHASGQGRQRTIQRWRRWSAFGVQGFCQAAWHRERARWRGYSRRAKGARARRAVRTDQLARLVAAYAQYHLANGGYFLPTALPQRKVARLLAPCNHFLFHRVCGWNTDLARSDHYLSVTDLAALWHLPQTHDLSNLTHLAWKTSRTLLAPPAVTTGQGYLLGRSQHAGETVPVFFPWSCLQQNMLALASTGKGKSSWLLHLALALFAARLSGQLRGGLLQIDVHGDLARQTLASVPPELEQEVVLINLAERTRLVGLNPLDMSQGANADKLVDNMIAIIEAIWSNSYGPRTESILEYACKSLVAANRTIIARDPIHGPDEQYTLLDVVPLLRERSFRHAVLEQVDDPFIHSWWAHYFEEHDKREQDLFTSSVVTKLAKCASSQVARRILGQPRSTINFADVIAQEKLLLISCASGEVGADIAAFMGAILLGLFHIALAEQASLDATTRRRFLVLIDEFQALKGVDYQTMLAELRKYGGSFALATQSLSYLDKLERTLRATVLANIDHLFAFAMSADDAALLRLESVEPEDVVNLPNYTCYARWLQDGQRLPLFSLALDDPIPTLPSDPQATREEEARREARLQHIAVRSHLRYGRPVGDIDALLLSIQARQAILMEPRKMPGKQASTPARTTHGANQARGISQKAMSGNTSPNAARGTKRRGSGKGGQGNQEVGLSGNLSAEASTRGEADEMSQDVPIIHDLFGEDELDAREEEQHV